MYYVVSAQLLTTVSLYRLGILYRRKPRFFVCILTLVLLLLDRFVLLCRALTVSEVAQARLDLKECVLVLDLEQIFHVSQQLLHVVLVIILSVQQLQIRQSRRCRLLLILLHLQMRLLNLLGFDLLEVEFADELQLFLAENLA